MSVTLDRTVEISALSRDEITPSRLQALYPVSVTDLLRELKQRLTAEQESHPEDRRIRQLLSECDAYAISDTDYDTNPTNNPDIQ